MTEQQQQQLPNEQELPRIYTLQQIEAAISASGSFETDLMEEVERGFVAHSGGQFNAAPIQTMGAPPMAPYSATATATTTAMDDNKKSEYAAQTCVKSGYITGDSHFVIKVATGGYPIPSNTGLLQVYSQTTGKLECLLLDEGVLTEHRTAAVGAVAAKYLAPKDTATIGILGTGVQARYQLRYLAHVTSCRRVLVWGRTAANVLQLQADILNLQPPLGCGCSSGWTVEIASDPGQLLERCDLVVTVTSSRSPLLMMPTSTTTTTTTNTTSGDSRRRRAQHITCIGADAPGKLELDPKLVQAADLLVADSRLQTTERGEFQAAIAQNLVNVHKDVLELGELLVWRNCDLHRRRNEDDDRLTIFDSSGVAVQDVAVAKLVAKLLVTGGH